MRLAYVASSMFPSRFANTVQVLNMCVALGAAGWDVTLFLPGRLASGARLQEAYDTYNVSRTFALKTVPVPDSAERVRGLMTAVLVRRALTEWSHASGGLSAVYTRLPWLGLIQSRVALFYESHFLPDTPYAVSWRLAAESVKASMRRGVTKAVFAISEELARRWRIRGVPDDRVHVLHDGVQVEQFGQVDQADARLAVGLPPDQPVAVYAGQMFPDRGPATIFEAAPHAPDVLFVLVGGLESDIAVLRRAAAERRLSNVHVVGYVPYRTVPMYLAAADVLLIPYSSRWRYASVASPLKVFECMAAGRPIVASRVPAVSQIIEDRQSGLLIPPDDPRALAQAIRSLLHDRVLATHLASYARESARKHTWLARAVTATELIRSHCA